MAATKTRRRTQYTYTILDSQEADVVINQAPTALVGITRALEAEKMTMQVWLKDTEVVLTFCRRGRITAEDLAPAVSCDPQDLEEL